MSLRCTPTSSVAKTQRGPNRTRNPRGSPGRGLVPLAHAPLAEEPFDRGDQLGDELDLVALLGRDADDAVGELHLQGYRHVPGMLGEEVAELEHLALGEAGIERQVDAGQGTGGELLVQGDDLLDGQLDLAPALA